MTAKRRVSTKNSKPVTAYAIPTHTPAAVAEYEKYDGAELRPFTGRPGAMDAYSLPSRIAGSLIKPKGN